MSAGRYAPPNWPAWTGPLAYGHATATRIASVTLVRSVICAARAAGGPATGLPAAGPAAGSVAGNVLDRSTRVRASAAACATAGSLRNAGRAAKSRTYTPRARRGGFSRPASAGGPSTGWTLRRGLNHPRLDQPGVGRPRHGEELARIHVARDRKSTRL